MSKHLLISDVQCKAGIDISYLEWIGRYAVEKRPDVIIQIGDFADMPSLSSYDVGKRDFEGRRYKTDIEAAHTGMSLLLGPIAEFNEKARKNKDKQYNPRLVLTLGNHEDRINRAVNKDSKLDGTIGIQDLGYEEFGWEVYPYLEPVVIDGVAYSHFFTSGVMGKPVPNAKQLVIKKHMSCTMGHVQNWDIHREASVDGRSIIGLFAGSSYTHNEDYLGPQGNNYDRLIWMKHEVKDGAYFPMPVSLKYLKDKYGN